MDRPKCPQEDLSDASDEDSSSLLQSINSPDEESSRLLQSTSLESDKHPKEPAPSPPQESNGGSSISNSRNDQANAADSSSESMAPSGETKSPPEKPTGMEETNNDASSTNSGDEHGKDRYANSTSTSFQKCGILLILFLFFSIFVSRRRRNQKNHTHIEEVVISCEPYGRWVDSNILEHHQLQVKLTRKKIAFNKRIQRTESEHNQLLHDTNVLILFKQFLADSVASLSYFGDDSTSISLPYDLSADIDVILNFNNYNILCESLIHKLKKFTNQFPDIMHKMHFGVIQWNVSSLYPKTSWPYIFPEMFRLVEKNSTDIVKFDEQYIQHIKQSCSSASTRRLKKVESFGDNEEWERLEKSILIPFHKYDHFQNEISAMRETMEGKLEDIDGEMEDLDSLLNTFQKIRIDTMDETNAFKDFYRTFVKSLSWLLHPSVCVQQAPVVGGSTGNFTFLVVLQSNFNDAYSRLCDLMVKIEALRVLIKDIL
jgi:hypothetical protein